ncbi:MAG: hypothetical protein JKX73_07445, partial [Flavobacteriales bacterium]|nr:hypothetical protein [Flavobacteriales bacterium]
RFEDRERIYVEYLKDNALATGTVSFFYPDGVKREERSYINGIIHGTWFLWHLNGQIAKETEFNKGQETGITRIYNEVGLLKEERYFSPDSVVKVRTWYDTGILKQEQEFYSSTSYVVIGNPGYGRGYHGIYDTEHYHVKERQFERVSLNRTKWHRNGVKASELIEDASGNISRTWDKYGKLTYDSSQRR